MKESYVIKQDTPNRYCYTFVNKNTYNESIVVEFMKVTPRKHWDKNHQFDWWAISVYVYDEWGQCWGKYNPQIKKVITGTSVYGNPIVQYQIDMNWVLPAIYDNAIIILKEVEKRAFNRKEVTQP